MIIGVDSFTSVPRINAAKLVFNFSLLGHCTIRAISPGQVLPRIVASEIKTRPFFLSGIRKCRDLGRKKEWENPSGEEAEMLRGGEDDRCISREVSMLYARLQKKETIL